MKILPRRWSALALLPSVLLLSSCTVPARSTQAPPAGPPSRLLSAAQSQDYLELQDWHLKRLWAQDLGQLTASRPLAEVFSAGKYVVVEADKGEIHCIDAATGVWKATAVLSDNLERAPRAVDDKLYLIVRDDVFTFDAATGKLGEGCDPQFALSTAPLVYKDDLILVGTNGFLALLPMAGGQVKWLASLGGPIFVQPVLAGDALYATSSDSDVVLAWDLAKGRELWRWRPSPPAYVSSGAAVQGQTIYVGDNLGFIHALNAADGQQTWKMMLEAPIEGRLTNAGPRTLILTNKPSLVCLGDQRQVQWHCDGVKQVLTMGKQTVYVLKDDRTIAAVNLDTGKEAWADTLPPDCKIAGDSAAPVFYIGTAGGAIYAFQELD